MSTDVNVTALAKLARLAVSSEELEKLRAQIPAILSFVETIQKVETKDEGVDAGEGVMREDTDAHEGGIFTDALMKAAPRSTKGFVAVRQVISRKK